MNSRAKIEARGQASLVVVIAPAGGKAVLGYEFCPSEIRFAFAAQISRGRGFGL